MSKDNRSKLEGIVASRSEDYGDFELNMLSLTRVIEAMVTQHLQMKVNLPNSFGARVMSAAKTLRQCHKHKQDNIDDRINYDEIADSIDCGSLSKFTQLAEHFKTRKES